MENSVMVAIPEQIGYDTGKTFEMSGTIMVLVNRDNTCCFTGHRTAKLPWKSDEQCEQCQQLKEKMFEVAEAVYFSGIRHFICGMAEGCDLMFAEAVIQLRQMHPEVTLEAAIPCEIQAKNWSEATKKRYYADVSACDVETLVNREYTKDCMIKRNKYMVDNSSVLIAVYNGTRGGTMQTIHYAEKKGLEIIRLIP